MASMIFPDDSRTYDLPRIQETLGRIGVTLRDWSVPERPNIKALLDKAALDDAEQSAVLKAIAHRLEELERDHGYRTCDMVVMHEHTPGLADMLAKFEKIHYHTDDEVRYVLAGKGYFGFVGDDGGQFMLEVTAGDYINVPAETKHWFTLGDSARIKAVRYFTDKSGWTPVYTDTACAFDGGRLRGSAA